MRMPETGQSWTYSRFRTWIARNKVSPDEIILVSPAQMMDIADWPHHWISYDTKNHVCYVGVYALRVDIP